MGRDRGGGNKRTENLPDSFINLIEASKILLLSLELIFMMPYKYPSH